MMVLSIFLLPFVNIFLRWVSFLIGLLFQAYLISLFGCQWNLGEHSSKNFCAYSLGILGLVPGWNRFLWSSFILPFRSVLCWRLFMDLLTMDNEYAKLGFISCSRCSLCFQFWRMPCTSLSSVIMLWQLNLIWEICLTYLLILLARCWIFFSQSLSFKMGYHLENLFLAGLIAGFSAVWYASNRAIFDHAFVPVSRA